MVPDGSTCTVTEANPGAGVIGTGNSSTAVIAPAGFTISGKDVNVAVTNRIASGTINKGTVTVTKTVTGNLAADMDGNVFGISVKCTGTPDANFSLEKNQSATVEGTIGATCTTTEPTVTLAGTQDPAPSAGYMYLPNIAPSQTTLKVGPNNVAVENMVALNGTYHAVTLTNTVNGPATAYDISTPFKQTLNCGGTYSWSRDLYTGDQAMFYVPTGASCTAATTGYPSILDTTYEWKTAKTTYSQPNPFNVPAAVTDTATYVIDKVIGNADCTKSTVTATPSSVDATGTSTSTLTVTLKDANGNTPASTAVAFKPLAAGEGALSATSCQTNGTTGQCTVTYTSPSVIPGGASSYTVHVTGTLACGDMQPATITLGDIGNRSIKVTKHVDGTGYTGLPFNVTVTCGGTQTPLQLVDGQTKEVIAKDGDACSITEDTPGASVIGAGNTNMSVIAPAKFKVSGVDENVVITNRITSGNLPKGSMNVAKVIGGDSGDITAGHIVSNQFNITVACTGVTAASFNLKANQSATVEGPQGAQCTISEPSVPPANAGYQYVTGITPALIPSLGTAPRDVTVENTVVRGRRYAVLPGHPDQPGPGRSDPQPVQPQRHLHAAAAMRHLHQDTVHVRRRSIELQRGRHPRRQLRGPHHRLTGHPRSGYLDVVRPHLQPGQPIRCVRSHHRSGNPRARQSVHAHPYRQESRQRPVQGRRLRARRHL